MKNFADFSSKTGTSWCKIALTNIYCCVSHPPRCTQKACYESAERQIAASSTGSPSQPAAGSGCRKRISDLWDIRLPVPVCCLDGRRLSAGDDPVRLRFRGPMRSGEAGALYLLPEIFSLHLHHDAHLLQP